MRILIVLMFLFAEEEAVTESFKSGIKLCTYPLDKENGKMLLFNFKTRSQVTISLKGNEVKSLGKGPYLFDLEILNPKHKLKNYEAKIEDVSNCKVEEVVRFVDGQLRAKK